MTLAEDIAIWNIVATVLAVVTAPIIALWVGGIIKRRSDLKTQKTDVLELLLSLRHTLLAPDTFRVLNSIDIIFVNEHEVRDAWTKYYNALNDAGLSNPPGYAVREEKRRDLINSIIKCLGLENKITTADILRAYTPTTMVEIEHLAMWERIHKREELKKYFEANRIGYPDYAAPFYPPREPGER